MSSTALLDNVASSSRAQGLKDKILPGVFAIMLGLVLLYAAGFAETSSLHNAAHDGRHSASFPCH